ncbi:MAG: class I SAM-dependent methyltransferase [Hymenobacter sp.]
MPATAATALARAGRAGPPRPPCSPKCWPPTCPPGARAWPSPPAGPAWAQPACPGAVRALYTGQRAGHQPHGRAIRLRRWRLLPTDLLLLRAWLRRVPGCRYFEIGTWRGERRQRGRRSRHRAHPQPERREMRALRLSERYIELHGHFSRPLPNVTHLHGNSRHLDLAGLNADAGPFDLVFIDGDHRYDAVRRDTARVMPTW